MDHPPLVSIGIPLYRSRRFLENIIGNIGRLSYPNLEIVISDRHCYDDALDQLRKRYGDDSRFRFVAERDEVDWVDHYNLLLRTLTGKYFLWMPHDDIYPASYVRDLADCLEAHPRALCAFGSLAAVDLEGAPLPFHREPPDCVVGDKGSVQQALGLLLWGAAIGFRGLFRRAPIMATIPSLPSIRDNFASDAAWMFGLALRGSLRHVPHCCVSKRYYPDSTSRRRRATFRHRVSLLRVLHSQLIEADIGWGQFARASALLWAWEVATELRRFFPEASRAHLRQAWYRLLRVTS